MLLLLALLSRNSKCRSRADSGNARTCRTFNAHIRVLTHRDYRIANSDLIVDRVVRLIVNRHLCQRNIVRQELDFLRVSTVVVRVIRIIRRVVRRLFISYRIVRVIRIIWLIRCYWLIGIRLVRVYSAPGCTQ